MANDKLIKILKKFYSKIEIIHLYIASIEENEKLKIQIEQYKLKKLVGLQKNE